MRSDVTARRAPGQSSAPPPLPPCCLPRPSLLPTLLWAWLRSVSSVAFFPERRAAGRHGERGRYEAVRHPGRPARRQRERAEEGIGEGAGLTGCERSGPARLWWRGHATGRSGAGNSRGRPRLGAAAARPASADLGPPAMPVRRCSK